MKHCPLGRICANTRKMTPWNCPHSDKQPPSDSRSDTEVEAVLPVDWSKYRTFNSLEPLPSHK